MSRDGDSCVARVQHSEIHKTLRIFSQLTNIEQFCERLSRIGRAHEGFADEEGADALRAQAAHIDGRGDPALGHHDTVPGDARQQPERGLEPRFEAAQVAGVERR